MKGLLQVYTGDGKGKTTAALGLLVRAVGAGHRVFFGQFLKDGASGECRILKNRFPEVTCTHYGSGQWVKGRPSEADIAAATMGFEEIRQAVAGGEYDLVIADEILHVVSLGLIRVEQILKCIRARPGRVELVLTGRDVDPQVLLQADLVTEMVCRRHPFNHGVAARRGIEY